jgi:hypothetical protein
MYANVVFCLGSIGEFRDEGSRYAGVSTELAERRFVCGFSEPQKVIDMDLNR